MRALSEWPRAQRSGIRGVFTDMDDTLCTQGIIDVAALQALHRLLHAGLEVIAITGRPLGWCRPLAEGDPASATSPWPVKAFVAENGGAGLLCASRAGTRATALYPQDAATRSENQRHMAQVLQDVRLRLPGVQLSRDQHLRETDLAFDHHEFQRMAPSTLQQLQALLHEHGMQTTLSSIHLHGCFGPFDKWQGARWMVQQLHARALENELERWVFVGDSGNDQPVFRHGMHSVGVANIRHCAPQLQHLPVYVCQNERGAGFAELADALLDARAA